MTQAQQQSFLDDSSPKQGPVECLGLTFADDAARRAYFSEKLHEKLQEPAFRQIEGFPIGQDEDILALSDPPYYTACPNPFIEDFIRHYGKPYNPTTDQYRREPFAADVSEGKNDPIYRIHSYHTKVPPKAIQPYLEHYTDSSDIVLDAFGGSGMTGLACQALNRSVILCDLEIGATFIERHYNSILSVGELEHSLRILIKEVEKECGWMYRSVQNDNSSGVVNYAILSEVFFCPNCSQEVLFWVVDNSSRCPHCDVSLEKKDLQRKLKPDGKTEIKPVRINYKVGRKRFERDINDQDLVLLQEIEATPVPYWYPNDLMMHRPSPWGGYYRAGYHQGYNKVSDFYTKRNLYTLACMWEKIDRLGLPNFMKFVVTSLLAMRCSLRMPFREGGRSAGAINNLHIPSLIQEYNPIGVLERKGQDFINVAFSAPRQDKVCITTQSSTDLRQLTDNCIDYIFIDPPFGSNILYAELNFLWEAWLKVFSNEHKEAIVSDFQKKGFDEYQSLMKSCFEEMYRVLKPGRWMTVEFHNSQNSIWNAIQEAIISAKFVIADVRTLDKQQGSYKQVSTAGAVKQDLIISCYKPNGGLEERFKLEAGSEEGAWDFTRTHLRQLPVFTAKAGQVEPVAERMDYLLFDRMVAFHVQRGVLVPLSAAEFYAGLEQRFPKRDEMYFLPDQVAEYDQKRMTVKEVLQLQFFVTDESSAIQWLKQQLTRKPQTFQDLQPQFMREVKAWEKYEKTLELSELLEQNYLAYNGQGPIPEQIWSWLQKSTATREQMAGQTRETADAVLRTKAKDRWYVPDPTKAGDLEKLREKALLKEFEEYRESKQKQLKLFRLEAVRAGFKKAWQERDYRTIIQVAEKIPENVLQEDPKLLMWYDQAVTRSEM